MSRTTERIGEQVRLSRRAKGLTQAQLAEAAGVGLAFLYDLEYGKPTLRLDKVQAVLDVLGLRLEILPVAATADGLKESDTR
jgi:y4mF family transcriptional regulator